MPYVKRNWCAHPRHLETSSDGRNIFTKLGPKPNHPLGSRRIDPILAKFINERYSNILNDVSLMLNESHSLCTKCYEEELVQYQAAEHERTDIEINDIMMDDGHNEADDKEDLKDKKYMEQVKRDYAIEKLNEVFKLFQLEPLIPRNTIETKEKVDRIYLMLHEWLSYLSDDSKEIMTKNILTLDLSLSELEDCMYRLRRLVDKSDYYEQILLMQIAPVEWGWKKIEKFFNCTSYQARAAVFQRTEEIDLSKPVDGRGRKPFDSKVAELIQDFYLDDEISRQSSYSKDTRISKELGTVVIRYMTMSIGEAFQLFKIKYPDVKVSRSKFHTLRPKWVRQDPPHQAVNKILRRRLNGSDLVDKTVCVHPTEGCYNRMCDACCNMNVSSLFITDREDIDEKADTSWSLWTTSNNHVELLHYHGSFRSLIDQLDSRWSSFLTHTYVTRQQREHIKTVKLTSHPTTFAVVQMDFAENFSFVVQKQIQSAYWHQKQASLYTVVITVGTNHHNMVIISNRMVHDTAFVYCTQKLIVKFIKDEYPTIQKINYISDGAPSQFKNNHNMMNLAVHLQDFNVKAAWTFTSSGHGRSPCDGLGAFVKSTARKYLLKQGPGVAFCSAKDFYQFTLEKTSRILYTVKSERSTKTTNLSIDQS
ncbi:unnamed protein product [Rotaria sp. Silwood1]|nr:unnamed protein product [Rotaria sp. Silwood1]